MIEHNLIRKFSKRAGAALLLLCILSFTGAAQVRGGKPSSADENMDIAAVRKDIVRFEEALDEGVSAYSRNPFSIINKVKGVYLPGYGLNFSFRINLQRAMMTKSSGDAPRRQVTPEQKKQWIEELKEKIIRLLQDNGSGFQQLRRDDGVTIVAFIDDRSFLDPGASKTVVLRVFKKDLDELGKKGGNSLELKQRIKIFEY